MENEMTNSDWKLQELAEIKSYVNLTNTEQEFVLSLMSESEYELTHNILKASASHEVMEAAAPLVFPVTSAPVGFIYKGLLALCVGVIALLLFTPILNKTSEIETLKYLAVTDTVFETKIVSDTFFITEEKVKYIDRPVYLTADNDCPDPVNIIIEEPRLLEVRNTIPAPDLSVEITSNGSNASNDKEIALVFDFGAIAGF